MCSEALFNQIVSLSEPRSVFAIAFLRSRNFVTATPPVLNKQTEHWMMMQIHTSNPSWHQTPQSILFKPTAQEQQSSLSRPASRNGCSRSCAPAYYWKALWSLPAGARAWVKFFFFFCCHTRPGNRTILFARDATNTHTHTKRRTPFLWLNGAAWLCVLQWNYYVVFMFVGNVVLNRNAISPRINVHIKWECN